MLTISGQEQPPQQAHSKQLLADRSETVLELAPPSEAWQLELLPGEEHRMFQGKTFQRNIFEGSAKYLPWEEEELRRFLKRAADEGKQQPVEGWTQANLFRFLESNNFDYQKTLASIASHNDWRRETLPVLLTPEMDSFLRSGAVYLFGRDKRYRPIILTNWQKLDLKKHSFKFYTDLYVWFMEIITHNMFVPGKVEQLIIIDDFAEHGLLDIPFKFIEDFTRVFVANYKVRTHRDYMLNIPTSFYVLWKIFSLFLNDQMLEKIVISRQGTCAEMLQHIDASQLEQKYGGTHPNKESDFWPVSFP
jgi:hypothetical protein